MFKNCCLMAVIALLPSLLMPENSFSKGNNHGENIEYLKEENYKQILEVRKELWSEKITGILDKIKKWNLEKELRERIEDDLREAKETIEGLMDETEFLEIEGILSGDMEPNLSDAENTVEESKKQAELREDRGLWDLEEQGRAKINKLSDKIDVVLRALERTSEEDMRTEHYAKNFRKAASLLYNIVENLDITISVHMVPAMPEPKKLKLMKIDLEELLLQE